MVTPVEGVENLPQAVLACGGIGRYQCIAARTGQAVGYHEAGIVVGCHLLNGYRVNTGERWGFFSQHFLEGFQGFVAALDFYGYTRAAVEDKARQTEAHCLTVDEGPEAHALHDALHVNAQTLDDCYVS